MIIALSRKIPLESLPIQNNLGTCQGQTHYLSQYQVCDSMASSNLTPDLEEHDFGNRSNETSLHYLEDEANKIVDDNHECDLISFEMSEQELLDLNLLPDAFLPEKWISIPVSTPKKSETVTAGGFHSFDGFSPIEETSLVLNSSIADVFVRVVDKETETTAEDIDLFESLQSWEMSGNVSTEMLQIHHTQYHDSWAEGQLVASSKQPSEHLSFTFDPFDEMVYCNYNEEWNSIPLDYNSQDVKTLSELEKVERKCEVEMLEGRATGSEKANHGAVKVIEGEQPSQRIVLYPCTLRRTGIMQQSFQDVKWWQNWSSWEKENEKDLLDITNPHVYSEPRLS